MLHVIIKKKSKKLKNFKVFQGKIVCYFYTNLLYLYNNIDLFRLISIFYHIIIYSIELIKRKKYIFFFFLHFKQVKNNLE